MTVLEHQIILRVIERIFSQDLTGRLRADFIVTLNANAFVMGSGVHGVIYVIPVSCNVSQRRPTGTLCWSQVGILEKACSILLLGTVPTCRWTHFM